MEEHFSRSERRFDEKARRIADRKLAGSPGMTSLTPIGGVLEREWDLPFLENELVRYRSAYFADTSYLRFFTILPQVRITEEESRACFKVTFGRDSEVDYSLVENIVNKIRVSNDRNITNIVGDFSRRFERMKYNYVDEDHSFILDQIEEGIDIPVVDLLREKTRVQGENVSLLEIQVDYLRAQQRAIKRVRLKEARRPKAKKQQIAQIVDVLSETQEDDTNVSVAPAELPSSDIPVSEENFSLSDWQVFWSERPYSLNPNHLSLIPTTSREAALDQLDQLSRKVISIKASSILSSLEFHLRKDVLQRAMAARNMHYPEGVREWIKIKRGHDRIFLFLPPDEPNNLIFFAGGRDVVYRGI